MAVFRENWVLNIIFIFKTSKCQSLHGTASSDVFCVKISFAASAVGSFKEQKKRFRSYFTHMGRNKTRSDLHKILHCERYPGHNYLFKFWGRSIKPFLRGEGSNF